MTKKQRPASPEKLLQMKRRQKRRAVQMRAQIQQQVVQAAQTASTFADWLNIYYGVAQGSPLEKKSLVMLAKLPVSQEQLFEVLEFAPDESALRALITKRLATQGVIELNGHAQAFVIQMPTVHERRMK